MDMKKKIIAALITAGLLAACGNQSTQQESHSSEYGDPNAPYPTATVGVSMNSEESKNDFLKTTYAGFRAGADANKSVTLLLDNVGGHQENQAAQAQDLLNKGAKALVLNIVNPAEKEHYVHAMLTDLCRKNIPVVYFNRDPGQKDLANCKTAYLITGDDTQSAILQGLQVLDAWEANPKWDKNGDGVIQYALIKTTEGVYLTEERSKWSINTMRSYPKRGKPLEQLFVGNADFSAALSEQVAEQWIADPRFANVEVILGNTDDVALGVVNALKKHNLKIPVFGVDGTEPAFRAVKSGDLAGTI